MGRHTLVVADPGQSLYPTQVDTVLPIPQAVPEVFSPLVACLPGELLAYYLAEAKDTQFFAASPRGVRNPGDRLRNSRILRSLEAWHDAPEPS
jgi:hypothetical protein